MPHEPNLPIANTIEIWTWELDVESRDFDALRAVLDDDELARASRFLRQVDGRRWIAARGGLRFILGRCLGLQPDRLGFRYNAYGKPSLKDFETPPVHFNLSHSGGWAVLAVTDRCDIGIDIEEIKPLKEDIARRFFSVKERRALETIPPDRYLAGFYRCWTRKEAFVKAHGAGLSLPLDSFDVTVDDDGEPKLERLGVDTEASRNWGLFDVQVPDGFAGALAASTRGASAQLRYRSDVTGSLSALIWHPEYSDPQRNRSDGSHTSPA